MVLDATGLNQVLPQSIAAAGLKGRVVLLGSVYNSVEIQLFPGLDSKDISLIGCHQPNNPYVANIGYPWCQKRERKLFLDYVLTKRVKVDELITHRFKADEAVQAYKILVDQGIQKMGIILNW